MLDICSIIVSYLQTNWTEDNPALANIAFALDEYDPSNPTLQVLLEDYPSKSNFITRDVYRLEHQCKITIYIRPVDYSVDTIATTKTTFLNMKTEIDRILSKRFSVTDLYSVEKQGWIDIEMAVGRDIKVIKEPIVFTSEQTIRVIYYEGEMG